jgi:predicted ATPase
MLRSLQFKFGSSKDATPLSIEVRPSITIFVGPNNSGKSQALREINNYFSIGSNGGGVVVESVQFREFNQEDAHKELEMRIVPPGVGDMIYPGHEYIRIPGGRAHTLTSSFISCLTSPNADAFNRRNFAQHFASGLILSLDGPSRIGLAHAQQRGDLKSPNTAFARLFVNDAKRQSMRNLLYGATGLYFALDASVGDHLHVKFGSIPPPNERSLDDLTLEYMRTARGFDDISDGIKAFTGILIQLHAGTPQVITVDEPEAFLHPSLAFKLGKELARGAAEEAKQVFCSTHSAQFLMGAISSGAEVNIVRLTHQDGSGTARLLPSEELKVLMQDPLLRSVGVLDGLFLDSVLVGEANADRAFYQEINERLLAVGDTRGAARTLFLNADTKQTIPRIVLPLRKLGIPAVGVVDIDVLKDGGAEWTRHLNAIGIPPSEQTSYATRRVAVLSSLDATGKNFKTEGGITVLNGSEREAAENLLDNLARYGLFIVPRGEIENWLTDLDVDRSKNKWLRNIFEKMGSDPSSEGYVKPQAGDVWDFVGQISQWINDKGRRGIPA